MSWWGGDCADGLAIELAGGDCAGGVVIAPIAPAGQRLRPVRGERKQGVGRTEARRRQGAGRAEAS